jgi:hypothetical protein
MHNRLANLPAMAAAVATLVALTPPSIAGAQLAKDACWIRDTASDARMRPRPLDSASVTLDAGIVSGRSLSYPNVNENASTPESRNSISKTRSMIGFGCRIS